jgi:hypothetical protein
VRLLNVFSVGVFLTVALLAGCSGSGVSPSTTLAPAGTALHQPLGPLRNKESRLIFNSSFGGNDVDYYLKGSGPNNPVAGSLSGDFNNPLGIGVDQQGDLYVANSGAENVLVYANGSTSPTNTLNDPDRFPADVAISSNGTVYVANGFGPMGASGNVVVYSAGATSPTQTLNDRDFLHVSGVALDKAGDLFVSCNATPGGGGTVVKFKAGSTNGTETHIELGSAGGVGFDSVGHLLAIDEQTPSLNVYDVGKKKPLYQLALPGTSAYFAFNKTSTVLYVADYGLGEIDVFRYQPNALKQIDKITNGITPSNDNLGIANTPPQRL